MEIFQTVGDSVGTSISLFVDQLETSALHIKYNRQLLLIRSGITKQGLRQ
jgi:hypothetical protein